MAIKGQVQYLQVSLAYSIHANQSINTYVHHNLRVWVIQLSPIFPQQKLVISVTVLHISHIVSFPLPSPHSNTTGTVGAIQSMERLKPHPTRRAQSLVGDRIRQAGNDEGARQAAWQHAKKLKSLVSGLEHGLARRRRTPVARLSPSPMIPTPSRLSTPSWPL